MTKLVPFRDELGKLVPDWQSATPVDSVPGSGLSYEGEAAYVLTATHIVILTPKGVHTTVHFASVMRVKDTEFKGLVIERDSALVAPNETFGIEVHYRGAGNFERTIRFLTQSANNARLLVEETTRQITGYLDEIARSSGTIYREKKE